MGGPAQTGSPSTLCQHDGVGGRGGQWNPLNAGTVLRALSYHFPFAEGYEGSIDGVGSGDVIDADGAVIELI